MDSTRQNLRWAGTADDPSAGALGWPDLRQNNRRRDAQDGGNVDEFDDVDASLAVLVLGDEGLRLPQGRRDCSLGHTLRLAGVHKQGPELPLSWGAQGFRHLDAALAKTRAVPLILFWDYPILGYLPIFRGKGRRSMRVKPELDPDVDDEAPSGPDITIYDERHFVTYLRLLDAAREGADWTEVVRIVLHRDPAREEERTRRCWESHLARARWMTRQGYRRILEQAVEETRRLSP